MKKFITFRLLFLKHLMKGRGLFLVKRDWKETHPVYPHDVTMNCGDLPFQSHYKNPGERSCGAMNRLMSEVPNCKEKASLSGRDLILWPGHFYKHELEPATKSARPQSRQLLCKEWLKLLKFQSFDWDTTFQEHSWYTNMSTWKVWHKYLSYRVKRRVSWLWSEFLAMKMWRERGEEGHHVVKDKHIWCMQSSRACKLIFSSKNWLSPGEILLSKNKIYSN